MSTSSLSRRSLLKATASLGALSALGIVGKRLLLEKVVTQNFKGHIQGPNFKRGHHLFLKNLPQNKEVEELKAKVCIVGTGVSGLSSAYHLHQLRPDLKSKDVLIFELEDHNGGNAHSYENKAPWGAHYLPLPNPDNKELIQFLKKIGVAKEGQDGTFSYDPFMIAGAPKERLFIYGRFQEGLVPNQNISIKEKEEIKRFFQWTKSLTHQKGSDGLYLFNIPMEKSSKDPLWQELDQISFKELLLQKGYTGEALHWYVNYCCRDDYGTTTEKISAWAGLHYFCSRRTKNAQGEDQVLTWPEGNNFLVKKLQENIPYAIFNQCLLTHVGDQNLQFTDFKNDKVIKVNTEETILALPQFVLKHLDNSDANGIQRPHKQFHYTPWMVANIHLKWDEFLTKELAWDNVNYHGKGLGFITSHHQSLKIKHQESILTYYLPITDRPSLEARRYMMGRTHNQWTEDILSDLEPMVFDIRKRITRIDIWPWGHAMISPQVGFLFKDRLNPLEFGPHIHTAHSDLSGLSLFEEAFYRGYEAAKKVAGGLKS